MIYLQWRWYKFKFSRIYNKLHKLFVGYEFYTGISKDGYPFEHWKKSN